MPKPIRHAIFALTLAGVCAPTAAVAQTYLWTGGHPSSDEWSKNNNWATNPTFNSSAALQFGGTSHLTPDMDGNYTVGSVTFVSGAGAFVLGSSTGRTLTLGTGGLTNNSSNLQTITNALQLSGSQTWNSNSGGLLVSGNVNLNGAGLTINGAANTTLSEILSNSSATLTKNGSGTLTLSGSNTYTGSTRLNSGTLAIGHNSALGTGTLTVYGGTLSAAGAGRTISNNVTLNSDFTIGGNQDLTINGTVNLGGSRTITVNNTGTTTFAGSVTEPWYSALTKAGSGELVLAAANSFSAPVTINAGTLTLAHNNALGGTSHPDNTVAAGASLALQGGITIADTSFVVSGNGVDGGGAIRNKSGDNTLNSGLKLAADSSVVSAADTLTLGNPVQLNAHTLTLSGAGAIVTNAQVSSGSSGGLVVSGAGDRTFSSAVSVGTGGLTVNGSGDVVFKQNLNAGSGPVVLASSGTVTFENDVFSQSLTLTSGTNVLGGHTTSGTITINGGNNELGGQVDATTLNHSSGSLTFTGDGQVAINNFNITGGDILFDKSSGHLRSDYINISNANVSFARDNQIFQWDDVTLGDGAVLDLNNTIQTIDNLTIVGDAIIDFGEAGSDFNINNLTLTGTSVLTITNWVDTLDSFFANLNPGSSSLAKIVFDGYGEAVWDPYTGNSGFIIPGGSPVPEPSSYGALLVSGLLGMIGCRRRNFLRHAA